MKVKTRFAPSPTGQLHIGSVRTAFYSWLYAKKNQGSFILRIEDTDLQRSSPEAIQEIMDSMKWLKLHWDEGPYFQTKRFNRYKGVIQQMLELGTAYKCYCSKERLIQLRDTQIKNGQKPKYDRYCLNKHDIFNKPKPYVVRFCNPQHGSVIFDDQIRGRIVFKNHELDDLIICRSDGSPTYNFCVVIDDWDMGITHIIRGEDHLNNTPRQINILQALGAHIPQYAHVSLLLGEDGKKLSKRHGAINVMQFRDNGFLPEALLNYLIRLGWSSGNQEIFSMQEMQKLFTLDAINKSPATFNMKKLLWLNNYYINKLPTNEVIVHLKWQLKKQNININKGPSLNKLLELLGQQSKTLQDMVIKGRYFYEDFASFDINMAEKYLNYSVWQSLKLIYSKFKTIDWKIAKIDQVIKSTATELNIVINDIRMPLRVAITGTNKSPALNMTIEAIGKERCIKRLKQALLFITKQDKALITKANFTLEPIKDN